MLTTVRCRGLGGVKCRCVHSQAAASPDSVQKTVDLKTHCTLLSLASMSVSSAATHRQSPQCGRQDAELFSFFIVNKNKEWVKALERLTPS